LSATFQFKDRKLLLNQSHVMGVLNVTPDSFSDGGLFRKKEDAFIQAEKMVKDGARFIDIGGESTRPGAKAVSVQEELDRVIPVVEHIAKSLDVLISVDTSSPKVMIEASKVGAHLINDVRGLQRDGAMSAALEADLPVCIMHMQGSPATMQDRPQYDDVIDDVTAFFKERLRACLEAGIDQSRVILDPGFGFGKTIEHNLRLVNNLPSLSVDGCPLLVGMSRKSMIGTVLNNEVNQRLAGSLALAAAAAMAGSFIIRVHDVAETFDVVRMLNAVRAEQLEK
jgi:dihydropteroate synthase